MKILICLLRNHGDIIRTFPLINSIKKRYPNSKIAFTCIEEMKETVKLCDDIDEIIIQPRLHHIENHFDDTRICDCSPLEDVVKDIRAREFDIYIDLHGVFQSAVIGALSQIPKRIGRSKLTTKDGAYLFYTDLAEINNKQMNKMERHFAIANVYFHNLIPNIPNINISNNKVLIIPGSSKKGILKRWNRKKYKELAYIFSNKYDVEILIGPEELDLYDYFMMNNTNKYNVKIIKRWEEYSEIYKKAKFVVGNDSASLHMSIWLGIPTFMICGPTSKEINAVWKYGRGCGIQSDISCKCKDVWSGICNEKCDCMNSLEVKRVYKVIDEYINNYL